MNSSTDSGALRQKGAVVCRIPSATPLWGIFSSPCEIARAEKLAEVLPALAKVEAELSKGRWAAGFISYEAGPAFDLAQKTLPPCPGFPLLWFGIYERPPEPFSFPEKAPPLERMELSPESSSESHCRKVAALKDCIHAGDTYQVNLTLRLRGLPAQAPEEAFLALASRHPTPYMAFANCGDLQAVSISPELFLERQRRMIATEPMKGTARRMPGAAEDKLAASWLANDEKNRAENLMIVDMARNDLGRVCRPGSIKVPELFKVSSFRTVHQMTSRVVGELEDGCGLAEILKASFPPASITGAPKIMAMEKIALLEESPRKLYTGCAGYVAPSGDFIFNVAIRTLLFEGGKLELGVGGGIVADSVPEMEWDECLAKSDFARHDAEPQADFEILETILWRRGSGFALLEEHMARAESSQKHFGRKWDGEAFLKALEGLRLEESSCEFARARALAASDGTVRAECAPLKKDGWPKEPLRVRISRRRVDSSNALARHKTSLRAVYDAAFKEALADGFDEALLLNERGELAEGAISSVMLRIDGAWATPPLDAGLLPGIWRGKQLEAGKAIERSVRLEELSEADEIAVGNSVRGEAPVEELWLQDEAGDRLIWRRRHT